MTTLLQKIKSLFLKNIYDVISNDDAVGLENLLRKGYSANKLDEFGQTPIFIVLYNKSPKQYQMLKLLVKYGADVNYKKNDNTTPIFYATKENAVFLIEKGANIFQMSNKKTTPLFNCFDIQTLDYFLSLDLNINHKDNNGETILHTLVYKSKEIVKFAIKNGANVNEASFNGTTPLIALAQSEYRNEEEQKELIEIAKVLLRNDADLYFRDEANFNAIDYCVEYKNIILKNWLEKNCS